MFASVIAGDIGPLVSITDIHVSPRRGRHKGPGAANLSLLFVLGILSFGSVDLSRRHNDRDDQHQDLIL